MEIKTLQAMRLVPELREPLLKRQVQIKGSTVIGRGFMFNGPVSLSANSVFYASSFDAYTYASGDSFFFNTQVGRYCSFANYCEVGVTLAPAQALSASSALDSTSPFSFYAGRNTRMPQEMAKPPYEHYPKTTIGHDVWLGSYVKVRAGVKIGTGAVVGANTFVTADVPPYAVVGSGTKGMQILKMRFSDEVIADLLASKWWEYDLPKLAERNEIPNEDEVQSFITLIKQRQTAQWPRLKDNWYFLVPESEDKVHLYPVPPDFAYREVMPAAINPQLEAHKRALLLAQNRYEKTHAKRRSYHLTAPRDSELQELSSPN